MQTFYLMVNNGAKIKKPVELWKLKTDIADKKAISFTPGSPEHKEWYANLKKVHKLK